MVFTIKDCWRSNFIELRGELKYSSLSTVGNDYYKFQAKMAVPMVYVYDDLDGLTTSMYLKIIAWGEIAEALGEVGDGKTILVSGVLQERSYDGKCRSCGTPERKYWSDILVTNFVVV